MLPTVCVRLAAHVLTARRSGFLNGEVSVGRCNGIPSSGRLRHCSGPPGWPLVWSLLKIIGIIAPLFLCVAYLTLAERRVIGYAGPRRSQSRRPRGLLQPIADGVKAAAEGSHHVPGSANKGLFILGPLAPWVPRSLPAWAVGTVLRRVGHRLNVDAGLLFLAVAFHRECTA